MNDNQWIGCYFVYNFIDEIFKEKCVVLNVFEREKERKREGG